MTTIIQVQDRRHPVEKFVNCNTLQFDVGNLVHNTNDRFVERCQDPFRHDVVLSL